MSSTFNNYIISNCIHPAISMISSQGLSPPPPHRSPHSNMTTAVFILALCAAVTALPQPRALNGQVQAVGEYHVICSLPGHERTTILTCEVRAEVCNRFWRQVYIYIFANFHTNRKKVCKKYTLTKGWRCDLALKFMAVALLFHLMVKGNTCI